MILSLGLHVLLFLSSRHVMVERPGLHGASRVAFRIKAPPPPPQQQQPPPQVEPPPAPRPRPERPRPRPTPRPAVEQPPEPTPDTPPPRPVFGVTKDSLVSGASGVAVRQGNTLAKKMERGVTTPSWVDALPPAAPAPLPRPSVRRLKPVPIYKLTRTPSFKSKVEPRYPRAARERGIQGTVLLSVLVDDRGVACQVRVLQSPDPALARAAVAALRRSLLHPGLLGKRPVAVRMKIPYRFVLDS